MRAALLMKMLTGKTTNLRAFLKPSMRMELSYATAFFLMICNKVCGSSFTLTEQYKQKEALKKEGWKIIGHFLTIKES